MFFIELKKDKSFMTKMINQDSNMTKHLFSCIEAAEYLGVKPQTLATWRLTKRENLPFVKVGRHCKYLLKDLDSYIERKRNVISEHDHE